MRSALNTADTPSHGTKEAAIDTTEADFERFVADARTRLSPAFIARYGGAVAPDVLAEVMAFAWEHQPELQKMENPIGYLYQVGRTKERGLRRSMGIGRIGIGAIFPAGASIGLPDIHPELHRALGRLSSSQRTAVVLTEAYGWTLREVSEMTGRSLSTVYTHRTRGLQKLRSMIKD